jgi:hypothetical protein
MGFGYILGSFSQACLVALSPVPTFFSFEMVFMYSEMKLTNSKKVPENNELIFPRRLARI